MDTPKISKHSQTHGHGPVEPNPPRALIAASELAGVAAEHSLKGTQGTKHEFKDYWKGVKAKQLKSGRMDLVVHKGLQQLGNQMSHIHPHKRHK